MIPLTPGHFLTLEPLNSAIPDTDISHLKLSRLSRWQLIQKCSRIFGTDIFLNIQIRCNKWAKPVKEMEVDDLVLIDYDVVSPLKWPLGRVVELFPGKDGHNSGCG